MDKKVKYNPFPLGKRPKELQRKELDQIKEMGYNWEDPRDVVDMFEKKVALFAGSKYAISVDCASNGLFLCLKYLQSKGELKTGDKITIPKQTYISVPMQITHAGNSIDFEDLEWSGLYRLKPTRIYDSSVKWTKEMYVKNFGLQVISFQIKKIIFIGRGGMIITDDKEAYDWIKLASYDGRDLTTKYTDENHIQMLGYHMYMTPEDAARGIILMDNIPEKNEDSGGWENYTDVSEILLRKE